MSVSPLECAFTKITVVRHLELRFLNLETFTQRVHRRTSQLLSLQLHLSRWSYCVCPGAVTE